MAEVAHGRRSGESAVISPADDDVSADVTAGLVPNHVRNSASVPQVEGHGITGSATDITPTSSQGRAALADDELVKIVRENFDLRPAGIIKMLDLRRPIYRQTAAYGHFGRNDLNLPWEATNKAEALKKYL